MKITEDSLIIKHIAKNLRTIRMLKGVSQKKLGNAVGISFQQIQKYECGINRISGERFV